MPSSYTVRSGDTLARISRAVYGDAAQWRRRAAANALLRPVVLDDARAYVWNTRHSGWAVAAATGKRLGLDRCRELYGQGGLAAVWRGQ
jgi:hypothetical protein